MLAVFDRSVAKIPEGLSIDESHAGSGASLLAQFSAAQSGAVALNLGASGAMAYTTEKPNPLLPRLFAAVDGIFCLFQGHIENVPQLKQQYGLNKTADEVIIIIEAYRTLRDRGPYPADQVVRGFGGKFAFVLYDSSSKGIFVAVDADGSVPFYWGTDSGGHLTFCDDLETMKKGCGKSFAPFPKGCFFTSSKGLQSFEHPMREVKAMPRVDSQGQVYGANYTVDVEAKKGPAMPRVGSEANWSTQF